MRAGEMAQGRAYLSHRCPCLAQGNLDTFCSDMEAPEVCAELSLSGLRPRLKNKHGVTFHSTPGSQIESHKGFLDVKPYLCEFGGFFNCPSLSCLSVDWHEY